MARFVLAALLAAALGIVGPAGAQETVRITNIGHAYWAGPLYVAQHLKLFEKHGLTAEVTTVQGGSLALQAALTKNADVAQVTFEHVLKAAVRGQRVVSIYRFASGPNTNILARNELLSRAKGLPVAERVRALRGARIAVPSAGGSAEKMLEMLATRYGLSWPGDVRTMYLGGSPGSYVAAFKANQIDAAVIFEPTGVFLAQAGLGGTLVDLMRGEEPMFNDVLFLTLTTHPDVIAQKAGLLRKVTAVYDEAMRIIHERPDEGKAVMAREFPNLSPEDNAKVYEAMAATWPRNGRMDLGQAQRTIAYMTELGELKVGAGFDPTGLFSNELLAR
jgi:NitT/TauT family transport system substrate-binding protein